MCASDGALGTPEFGLVVERHRVVERIAQSGNKPCVLFGPSGCGKSVAAAQYALSVQSRTIWVDAGGEFLSANRLAQTALQALGEPLPLRCLARESDGLALVDAVDALVRSIQTNTRTSGVLLVIDDLGAPLSPDEILGLRHLVRALWRVGSRVLVTSRGVSQWPSALLCECSLVGPGELALTRDEAVAYLGEAGLSSLLGECDELRAACGGHPAFFVVMASQATEYGLAARVARTPSLEAWLRKVALEQLSGEQKRALVAATLVLTGDDRDLLSLGIERPVEALDGLAASMPLAACTRTSNGGRTFRIHQLVDGYLDDFGCVDDLEADDCLMDLAVALLSERGDFPRAAELLTRQGTSERMIAWLLRYGDDAVAQGHYLSLSRIISRAPVAALMAQPRLLLVWAEVCAETGQVEDAMAKCRAARNLAEHAGDMPVAYRALALCARYAGRANRIEEAEGFATAILRAPAGQVSEEVVAEAMLCRAQNAVMQANYVLACELLEDAVRLSSASPAGEHVGRAAGQALALVPAIAWGDYLATSRALAPAIVVSQQYLTDRVVLKGNVAACLCEAGRLSRCEQLLRSVLAESRPAGLDVYSGAYLAVLGCAKVGQGEAARGIELMKEGIATSIAGGDEQGADQSRVHLATILRASGEMTESLVVAERAFERLTVADACSFRRLAALEVAASLLAIGDPAAASAWAGSVVDEGFEGNRHHALRATMILAEVARREGRIDDAIRLILGQSEYLLSENPNWQVAMYCRAFPGLIGVVALALGPGKLPEHLLRMIPPESAERMLSETRGFLDTGVWRELGNRLIGEPEMDRFLSRAGLPLCHVRLFGGLEVSVGGRVIRET